MLDKTTIKSLLLIPEVRMPASTEEKFQNSDKLWKEVDLGKKTKSSNASFIATQLVNELYLEASLNNF